MEQIYKILAQIIADTSSADEAQALISDLLSETERQGIAKRLAVALMLANGKSYNEIKKQLGVSSSTIARIQESLDKQGIKIAISKVGTDEWAGKLANKVAGALDKLLPKSVS